VFDGFIQPHSCIPYVRMGFNIFIGIKNILDEIYTHTKVHTSSPVDFLPRVVSFSKLLNKRDALLACVKLCIQLISHVHNEQSGARGSVVG
jgi:hypothetical protein